MKKREKLIDQFSAFLQFKNTRGSGTEGNAHLTQWASSAELVINMQAIQSHRSTQLARGKRPPDIASDLEKWGDRPDDGLDDPVYWSIYWHGFWKTDRRARQHLYAYLQEAGYFAALKQHKQYEQSLYSIAEYFQIAIAGVDKVLQGFQPDRNCNMQPFALMKFTNLIKDGLVREGLPEVQFRSDWSLLRQVSETRIRNALQAEARPLEQLQGILLAWDCYKQLYVPKQARANHQLAEPENWEAIAQQYNRQRITHPAAQPATHSAQSLKQQLQTLARSLRNYATLPTTALAWTDSEDLAVEEQIADLSETPLEQLIQLQESEIWQARQKWFEQFLQTAIAQVDDQTQELLKMRYIEGLTQKEIGERLHLSQPTASRRIKQLQQVKRQWLLQMVEEAGQDLHISINTAVIDTMSQALEEWLTLFYSSVLHNAMEDDTV
jgi:RNA polymerase sigma factor (sigma-70 family)